MFFVIDESSSVGSDNFELIKEFISNITNTFEIAHDNVQVGLMSFSTSPIFQFHLNMSTSRSSVLDAIDSLQYNGSDERNVADALDAVGTEAFTEENGARPASEGVPKIVIVIISGESNDYEGTLLAAERLHDNGNIVFAIGFDGANINELNGIASDSAYVFFNNIFDREQLAALHIPISQDVCVGKWQLMY